MDKQQLTLQVERERKDQGLPAKVESAAALRRIAALLTPARGEVGKP